MPFHRGCAAPHRCRYQHSNQPPPGWTNDAPHAQCHTRRIDPPSCLDRCACSSRPVHRALPARRWSLPGSCSCCAPQTREQNSSQRPYSRTPWYPLVLSPFYCTQNAIQLPRGVHCLLSAKPQ